MVLCPNHGRYVALLAHLRQWQSATPQVSSEAEALWGAFYNNNQAVRQHGI
jgi:hypothetical protein